MAEFVGQQIILGAYDFNGGYTYVMSKRPDLKNGIDEYLKSQGREDLIVK